LRGKNVGKVFAMNSLPKWKRHYLRRREKALKFLGGICAICESAENLEFDHIDPEQKSFSISGFLTHAWVKVEPELKKCQLLCNTCHKEKNKIDGSLEKMKKTFKGRKPQNRNSEGKFIKGGRHGINTIGVTL